MGKAPETVERLVHRFDRQSDPIRSPDYSETHIHIEVGLMNLHWFAFLNFQGS